MEIQRESIFVSALRGFCRAFFILLGAALALTVALVAYSALSSPYNQGEKTTLEVLPDLEWKRDFGSLTAPVILQINIHGVIGEPTKLEGKTVRDILVDSRAGLLANNRVKAILLHFDTPGGTVTDADNIYRMLLEYKETFKVPVYGYIDGLCASGGMYIASAADKLYSGPSGVIGSVGVIVGPFFNFVDAMGKIGVQAKTITDGLNKDMMSPFRTWKPDEDASLQALTSYYYQRFVDIVSTGRPNMDRAKLVNEYGANIFPPPAALERGYIDVADSSYKEAVLALMQAANLDPAKPYQIVELQPQFPLLSALLRGESPLAQGKIEHQLQIGQDKSFLIRDKVAYLYQP